VPRFRCGTCGPWQLALPKAWARLHSADLRPCSPLGLNAQHEAAPPPSLARTRAPQASSAFSTRTGADLSPRLSRRASWARGHRAPRCLTTAPGLRRGFCVPAGTPIEYREDTTGEFGSGSPEATSDEPPLRTHRPCPAHAHTAPAQPMLTPARQMGASSHAPLPCRPSPAPLPCRPWRRSSRSVWRACREAPRASARSLRSSSTWATSGACARRPPPTPPKARASGLTGGRAGRRYTPPYIILLIRTFLTLEVATDRPRDHPPSPESARGLGKVACSPPLSPPSRASPAKSTQTSTSTRCRYRGRCGALDAEDALLSSDQL